MSQEYPDAPSLSQALNKAPSLGGISGHEQRAKAKQLSTVRLKQIKLNINLGLHRLLGLSPEEYNANIPKFLVPSPESDFPFPYPVLIDPRVNLLEQFLRARLRSDFYMDSVNNISSGPQTPHIIWIQNGKSHAHQTVAEARQNLARHETGCTLLELISIYQHFPQLFRQDEPRIRGLSAIQSMVGTDQGEFTPYIFTGHDDLPEIRARYPDERLAMPAITKYLK